MPASSAVDMRTAVSLTVNSGLRCLTGFSAYVEVKSGTITRVDKVSSKSGLHIEQVRDCLIGFGIGIFIHIELCH